MKRYKEDLLDASNEIRLDTNAEKTKHVHVNIMEGNVTIKKVTNKSF